jgi:hypothetical protein
MEIYWATRAEFPESGPAPGYSKPLLKFVRAALGFVVSAPTIRLDGTSRRYFEADFIDTSLPIQITDAAIRGVFDRWRTRTKVK